MPLMRRGPGLIGMAARTAVVAGTATAVSGRVAQRQQERYARQEEAAYAAQAAAAPSPADEQPAYVAELQQLARLRDDGIISADDFEAKKRQILGI